MQAHSDDGVEYQRPLERCGLGFGQESFDTQILGPPKGLPKR